VRRTYSYNEAVQILGGREHPVIAAMDKVLGGALLVGSAGLWTVLDLFDAKPDFVRLSNDLLTGLAPRRRNVSRYTRTQDGSPRTTRGSWSCRRWTVRTRRS
jgi:hypothetical protein